MILAKSVDGPAYGRTFNSGDRLIITEFLYLIVAINADQFCTDYNGICLYESQVVRRRWIALISVPFVPGTKYPLCWFLTRALAYRAGTPPEELSFDHVALGGWRCQADPVHRGHVAAAVEARITIAIPHFIP